MPSGIYPPLQFPRIVIVAHSGTLPPQSMSLIVSRPIEQAIMAVPGVRRVRSKSIRGAAEISAQFDPTTDMIVALQTVQNRVAEITGDLPPETQMQIERMTPEIFPVFILSLTGAMPIPQLYDYANFVIKPEVARVPGAGIIDVQASDTREIEVVLDPAKLTAADLTVVDVADALKSQNTIQPVGRFPESGLQHLTLASGLWTNIDQIAQAPIKTINGATVRVADVGMVTPGAPDRTMLVTGNGRDAVVMTVAQQIGANILTLKAGLDGVLNGLAGVLPAGIRITRVYDLAEFVEESIANVRDAILIGGFLAIVVLLVFLRDWRLTLIAAVTLPMAIIPTFVFLWLFGGTINLMSLGGLAVAIGLVIDDAVVVVENIHRRAGEGGASVVGAVQQLMAPLVSSTLTTVVVFAPLGLLSGVPGQFFRALSLSLSVAVLISLALSISVVPLMARWAAARHRPSGEMQGRLDRRVRPAVARRCRSAGGRDRVLHGARGVDDGVVLPGRQRFLSSRRRRRFRPRLSDAGGQRSERNGSPGSRHRAGRGGHAGSGVLFTAHRIGAGSLRDRPEYRRHPGPVEAASPAGSLGRRDHQRHQRPCPRRRAAGRCGIRPAPAGHARGSRRESGTDRAEDLRRRPRQARGPCGPRRGHDEQD